MLGASRRRWVRRFVGILLGFGSTTAFAQANVASAGASSTPAAFPAPASILDPNALPIDLPSTLRLAGVQNPQILIARERITEADAIRQLAAAQLLPDINIGTNYDAHTGPLQQSNGSIGKVNRDSLYVGLGSSAIGGGTVTIPGVVWNNNLSEAYFGILISRQVVRQREFAATAVNQDVLLRVATGYVELLRAQGRRAIAVVTRDESAELARVTAAYARVGQGRQADADRAATELERRNSDILQSESAVLAASVRLCQLLNLDPSTRLFAADGRVVPSPIIPDPVPLCELLAIALVQRPELGERRAAVQEAMLALRNAKVLPFSPNLIVGYSSGSFGGGSNVSAAGIVQPDGSVLKQDRFGNFDGRSDFDAVIYWTLRNLGIGNVARIRIASSRLRANGYRELEVLDRVRAEVATAFARIHATYAQISAAERAVEISQRGFGADLQRTRNREGLPIEVQNSLNLLARSRVAYLDAISDYNRAQFEMYVALGQPPADFLARPVPPEPTPQGPAARANNSTGDAKP